jgi:DNA-binding MarR family transcriptional regulator
MCDSLLSMRITTSNRLFTELVLEIFRLNGRLLSAGDALARPADQTSTRWQVLGALDQGARTVAEIGRRMGLTRQSVQRTADLLEHDGLVAFTDNPAHLRAKLAMLTPRGRMTLEVITKSQIQWAHRIAGQLVEDDLRRALHTLQQVREAVERVGVTSTETPRHARLEAGPPRSLRTTSRRRA